MNWRWHLKNPGLDCLVGIWGQSNGVGSSTGSWPGTPSGVYWKDGTEQSGWTAPHDCTPAFLDQTGRGVVSQCKAAKDIDHMLNIRIPALISDFATIGRRPNAVFGWQGEADAKTEADARAWPDKASQCLDLMRAAWGDVPQAFAELLTQKADTYPYHELFRELQADWAAREGVTILPTVGVIALQSDEIHATSAGQIVMGDQLETWMLSRGLIPA